MEGDDLKAGNSMETPDNVTPVTHEVGDSIVLKGGSWNFLKFTR
jgi:alpha-N-arabinofuranosidase